MSDITQVLSELDQGGPSAADQLLPLVYDELHRLASAKMAEERPGQTLQATALVHEAYLRIVHDKEHHWNGRRHFFRAAAEAMRRILVENARRKAGLRAGGNYKRVDITCVDPQTPEADFDLLALNEALERLAAKDARKAELVKLRFFAGLTNEQAASLLGITARTAYADWRYARAWLRVELS